MSKSKKTSTEETHWWNKINQKPSKALSSVAKERRRKTFFKGLGISFLILVLFGVAASMVYVANRCFLPQCFTSFSDVVKEVVIETDGVLTEKDILRVLSQYKQTPLLNLDIYEPKEKLEKIPQIKSVIVERRFPSTLFVSINEYHPVFKIIINKERGKKEGLLVSDSGKVFKGYGYSRKNLKDLLYLKGVRLHKKNTYEYENVSGLETACELIIAAKEKMPHLYEKWHSLSLEFMPYGPDALGAFLKVQTYAGTQIIFSPKSFSFQLERLDAVYTYMSEQRLAMIESIDLSVNGQVSVKMARNNKKLSIGI